MKKRTLMLVLALSASLLMAVTGTLAYLTDTDSDVNVMTLGNVDIEQLENGKDNGFSQHAPLYPAYYTTDWTDADAVGAVEKEVTVKNIGESDAFVRTVFAFEAGNLTADNYQDMIHLDAAAGLVWTKETVEIDGVKYYLAYYDYTTAVKPGKETAASLVRVVMDKEAGNDLVKSFGGEYKIYVTSQAVQTANLEDLGAVEALKEAFGEITAAKNPWVDGTANPEEPKFDLYISSVDELKAFADAVNGGDTFKGKKVALTTDLDLKNIAWTPIGNSTTSFQGTFDGQGNTISNLTVEMPGKSNVGLFGMTTDGEIKNLKIHNATVKGRLNVGVVAGTPYTSKYNNITLTGDIKVNGMAYVGAVGGKNCYANVNDITVDVNAGSYVKADSVENGVAYRSYVGGVFGFMGEGSHTVKNVKSNIDVIGSTCDVGGIVGIAHYGNNFVNCSSSGNVTITGATEAGDAEEMGGIAGVWHNENGTKVTFEGCSYTGKLTANITAGVNLSDNTIVGKAYSASGTGELIIK